MLTRLLTMSLLGSSREARALTDVVLYHNRSLDFWRQGLLPGRDYPSEYPPGAMPFVLMPVQIRHAVPYTVAFACEILVFDALMFAFLMRRSQKSQHREGIWLWLLAVPLMGPMVLARLDMIPTVLCAIALGLAFSRKGLSGVLLGAAALVKLWPLTAIVGMARVPGWSRIARALVITLASGALLASVTGLFQALTTSIQTQSGRGVQVESFAALVPLWRRVLAGTPVHLHLANYATEVQDSPARVLAQLLFWASALAVAVLLVQVLRRRPLVTQTSPAHLAALATTCVVLGDKVFSPQYLVWIIGLLAVALTDGLAYARLLVGASCVAAALSHAVFPYFYIELLYNTETLPLVLLTVRDALLVGIVVLLVRALATPSARASSITGQHDSSPEKAGAPSLSQDADVAT